MTRLATLQEELLEADAAIARAERTLAAHPNVPSVLATLQTIQRRRENLDEKFHSEAAALGLEVCSYRIDFDQSRHSLPAITEVLRTFQKLFSTIYTSISTGKPKERATWGASDDDASTFDLAYTFPGSLGVALTIPNARPQSLDFLLDETPLDKAMRGMFEMVKAQEPEEIKRLASQFGVASIRVMQEWAQSNENAGFGAGIVWRRGDELRSSVMIQAPQLSHLNHVIKETVEETTQAMVGELLTVNMIDKKFQMRTEGSKIIEGEFDDAISALHSASVPQTYRAVMKVATKLVKSDDEEPVSYFLVTLNDPNEPSGVA